MFKKKFKKNELNYGLLKVIVFYLGQITLNLVLFFCLISLSSKFVVDSYVSTIFNEQFDSSSNPSYLNKVSLMQEHKLNQAESATLVLSKPMTDVEENPEYLANLTDAEYQHLAFDLNELIELKGGPRWTGNKRRSLFS